ncbi:Lipoprotein signal peptidase [Candidatus Rubidus massiliensis]|nr:Lipoprotein signal peptidase [Candidatus Rubidus massiliensis]
MDSRFPFYPYGGIAIFKNFLGIEFSISHATNKGAAWGLFANFQQLLLYFRIVLIAGLIAYIIEFNKKVNNTVPLSIIAAGAVGNVIDYFLYGHVVDMFHFILWGYDFPVFNIADSCIFIGICWLIVNSWIEEKKTRSISNETTYKN